MAGYEVLFGIRYQIQTACLFALFALYHLTIAFNAARDWSTLRYMILRIFHLLMAPSMLIVLRSKEFSNAHINILDCTPSFLTPFAPYLHLTIEFNAARVWNILRLIYLGT